MTPRLEVRDLGIRRGGRMLFEGLSFALADGGALIVGGPNGVGKSSLLRTLAGLLPASGAVEWRADTRVALMAEAAALDGERTLGDALRFWARLDDDPGSVDAALKAVGLEALIDVPVRLLSTGQRRRAALARVIVARAAAWLLDEPASGMDVESVARLEVLIAEHRAAGGVVVVATHQPIDLPGAQSATLP